MIFNVSKLNLYLRTSEMGDKVNANDDGTDTEMRREKEAIIKAAEAEVGEVEGRSSSRSKGGGGSRRRKKDA